ncbi:calcium-binding protein [Streptomyces sp. NPDC053431]|uniref:calcium-binding protein n=1 Tax=Streptomyces sp. NPDC053431 TaxID=3365703 RepID=UPI0037D11EE2
MPLFRMPQFSPWRRAGRAGAVGAAGLALVLSLPLTAAAAPGGLDPAFDGDGKVVTDVTGYDTSPGMVVQPDGKIVTIGRAAFDETSTDFSLVRYNPDGSRDTTFGGGDGVVTTDFDFGNDEGTAVALQPDGKIVAVGGTANLSGNGAWLAARYNPDGSLDPGFGGDGKVVTEIDPDAIETALAVVVQPDGRIVAGGESIGVWSLVRWNPDGALDPTFGGDGIVTTPFGPTCCHAVNDLALQPDGRIVAAGRAAGLALTRYNTDGSLDLSFDGDGRVTTGTGAAEGVALQSDGRIVTAGKEGNGFLVMRFTAAGAPDPSFDGDGRVTTSFGPGDGGAEDVALQSDGRIVTAGWYAGDFALARFDTGGSLDPGFDGDGRVTTDFGGPDDQAGAVALQSDGKILAAGIAGPAAATTTDRALARYLGGGGIEPPGVDVSVAKTGPTTASIGDTVTYTVTVRNNSTTTMATSVQLTDTLTGTATLLSATTTRGTCTVTTGRVTCAIGSLGTSGTTGATAIVTIVAEPSRTGTLTDTATVTAAQSDPMTSNNTATRTTTVNNNRGCTIIGTSGNDTLNGGYANDVICALSGNDTVNAGYGNDTVHAGPGSDRVDGGYHSDTLIGGPGSDTLIGNYGNDTLDTVDGVSGNDTANGGYNTDTCTTDAGDTRISCP